MEWNDFFQFLIAISSSVTAVATVIGVLNNKKK